MTRLADVYFAYQSHVIEWFHSTKNRSYEGADVECLLYGGFSTIGSTNILLSQYQATPFESGLVCITTHLCISKVCLNYFFIFNPNC